MQPQAGWLVSMSSRSRSRGACGNSPAAPWTDRTLLGLRGP